MFFFVAFRLSSKRFDVFIQTFINNNKDENNKTKKVIQWIKAFRKISLIVNSFKKVPKSAILLSLVRQSQG
jgi:hypothetical protein